MKEYLINKRLQELTGKSGHFSNKVNEMLFKEYFEDKLLKVPLKECGARTLLMLGNEKLIYFVLSSKFGVQGVNHNLEEFTVGKIGLVKAIDTYNINSGVKFNTYACRVIMNEIYMHRRKLNTKSNHLEQSKISFEELIQTNGREGAPIRLIDSLAGDDNFVQDITNKDFIDNVIYNLRYLTKNELFSVVNYFGLFNRRPKSQAEIADILKVSHSNVSRYLSSSLRKLKVLMLSNEKLTTEESIVKYQLIKDGPQTKIDTDIIDKNFN